MKIILLRTMVLHHLRGVREEHRPEPRRRPEKLSDPPAIRSPGLLGRLLTRIRDACRSGRHLLASYYRLCGLTEEVSLRQVQTNEKVDPLPIAKPVSDFRPKALQKTVACRDPFGRTS